MAAPWKILRCPKAQLCLDTVLVCGQSFRWKQNDLGEWLGVLSGFVWRLKQTPDGILYQVYGSGVNNPSYDTDTNNDAAKSSSKVNKTATAKKNHPSKVDTVENVGFKKSREMHQSEVNIPSREGNSIDDMTKNKDKIDKRQYKRKLSLMKSENHKAMCQALVETLPDTDAHVCDEVDNTTCHQSLHKCSKINNEDLADMKNIDAHYAILHDYFQLNVDIEKLYHHWSASDPHFSKVASQFTGIRMLRQDPVENLLSFVCSSNNHISRIAAMVDKLCANYGDYITTVDGQDYHSFPSLSALCVDGVETELRELGFGYRAKYIADIARRVTLEKGGDGWVRSLRDKDYSVAKVELMTLMGVGAKVADCVCLMSLDKPGAVPVDTHVWQITIKHYLVKLHSAKSLTDKIYNEIGTFYRNLWGPFAGWAHSVLFTADLRHNKERAALVSSPACTSTSEKKSLSCSKAKTVKSVKKRVVEQNGTTKDSVPVIKKNRSNKPKT